MLFCRFGKIATGSPRQDQAQVGFGRPQTSYANIRNSVGKNVAPQIQPAIRYPMLVQVQ
jgi:hypothetical protein